MKKVLFGLIVFLLGVFNVSAASVTYYGDDYKPEYKKDDEKIVYSITDAKIDSDNDTISFKGYAYISDIHSFGGKNYEVSIIAIRESDISSDNKVNNAINGNRYVEKYPNKSKGDDGYSGGHGLYPSTCYKIKTKIDNRECDEWPFDGVTSHTYDGETHTHKSASCNGKGTSCIHYNPFFEDITFSISELEDKFGDDKIVFLIAIKSISSSKDSEGQKTFKSLHYSVNTSDKGGVVCKRGDYCNIVNKGDIYIKTVTYGSQKVEYDYKKRYKTLTFSKGTNVDELSKEISGGVKFVYEPTENFTIRTGVGLVRDLNEGELKIASGYFRENATFSINSERTIKTSAPKFKMSGFVPTVNIVFYALNTKSELDGNYLDPGNGAVHYCASTLGTIEGVVKLDLKNYSPKTEESCNVKGGDSCSQPKYGPTNCRKKVKVTKSGGSYNKLNDSGCTGNATLEVVRYYRFTETTTLNIGNIFSDSNVTRGRSLQNDISFKLDRKIEWMQSTADTNTYYYVTRKYKKSNGCATERGWVSEDYVKGKLGTIPNFDSDFETTIKNDLVNNLKNIDYSSNYFFIDYVDSNDALADRKYSAGAPVKKGDTLFNITNNCKPSSISSNPYECNVTFNLKNAWINSNNNGYVVYQDSAPTSDGSYINGGMHYYFPFNYASNVTSDKFVTVIGKANLIKITGGSDINLTSDCSVNFASDGGNYENMVYRVIDLNNPFPNYNDEASIPSNWLALWKSNNGFDSNNNIGYLLDRIDPVKSSSIEKYVVNLSMENIIKVKNDTGSTFKYNVDSVFDDILGNSKYLKENPSIFSKYNVSKGNVGEAGVND